jgi:hypothetical protein
MSGSGPISRRLPPGAPSLPGSAAAARGGATHASEHLATTPAGASLGASRTPSVEVPGPLAPSVLERRAPATHAKPSALDGELSWILPRLRQPAPAELSDAELSSLRSQVRTLDKAGLEQLRRGLERALPTWRTRRAPEAKTGPATVDKIMAMVGGPGRLGRLPRATRDELRTVREANVDALLARAALRIVNGNDGVFRRYNGGDVHAPEGFDVTVGGRRLDHIDQRYALVERVSGLLRVGYGEDELTTAIAAAATSSAPTARARAEADVPAILEATAQLITKRAQSFQAMSGPVDLSDDAKARVAHQLSQVRWLEARAVAAEPSWSAAAATEYKDDLRALLTAPDAAHVLEAVDARFEAVMEFVLSARLRADGLDPLPTVRVERLPAERVHAVPDTSAQRLAADHPVRQRLDELGARLAAGERSAVGVAYATQTFPEEILGDVARGELKVVAFDGSRDNGVRYIRDTYGISEGGVRSSCRLMGLQGIYGSYPRTLVTLDDGQQFLLLTGYGASRQLNNAATPMLYTTPEGQRVQPGTIDLATDGTDFRAAVRQDLLDALVADWGDRPGAIDDVPTRLMILQNPVHLEHLLGDQLRWGTPPDSPLVPFLLAYRTHPGGHEERVIIPKVGGGGLYGDTAGQFLEAFYGSGLARLSPDVIFNGAAGGFAGTAGTAPFAGSRGLPMVEPGGVFMPTEQVEQYGDGRGPQVIPGMLPADPAAWPAALIAAREAAGVHTTSKHVAIAAPAVETFPLIHGLVAEGHASIDVEAAAIMEAARKLGKTCTVVYTHSDDPRASEAEPNTALGMVAPFLEGSHYHAPLFGFLAALWDHSVARQAQA